MLLLLGCATTLDDLSYRVEDPRVLAVTATPAEAAAGATVALGALYADASGPLDTGGLRWFFCLAPKPLAELGPVDPSCLVAGSPDLAEIADPAQAVIPADTCSLFGPNPPLPEEGEPAGRPVDPDVTGGYYQPVVVFDGEAATLAQVRIRCGIANVSQDTYVAWNLGYHDTVAPSLEVAGGEVAAGGSVDLELSWPVCPVEAVCGDGVCSGGEDRELCAEDCEAPVGCGGSESYSVYDGATKTMGLRREALSATWFVADGEYQTLRNGRSGEETETTLSNAWTAPQAAGAVWGAVVLRDERGGVSYQDFTLTVR